MKIDGSCHCGAITYEAEVDPERVYVCHCSDCQAISGSPYRWAVPVGETEFRLLTGRPKAYVKVADSGRRSHQHFCPDCASPIYSFSTAAEEAGGGDAPKSLNLRLGTARQRAELPPRTALWCGSAQDWAAVAGTAETLDAQ
jgi:hypothetical protein